MAVALGVGSTGPARRPLCGLAALAWCGDRGAKDARVWAAQMVVCEGGVEQRVVRRVSSAFLDGSRPGQGGGGRWVRRAARC